MHLGFSSPSAIKEASLLCRVENLDRRSHHKEREGDGTSVRNSKDKVLIEKVKGGREMTEVEIVPDQRGEVKLLENAEDMEEIS